MKGAIFAAAALVAAVSARAADEYSVRFWVKVPALPATVQAAESFRLDVAADGACAFVLPTTGKSGVAEYVAGTSARLRPGVWTAFALQYSRPLRHVRIFCDQKVVYARDGVLPPRLAEKGTFVAETPGVDVKEFSSYPYFVEQDYLFFATEAQLAAGRTEAEKLSACEKAREYVAYYDYFKKVNGKVGYGTFPVSRIAETRELILAANADAARPKTFRLMSYNIHMGMGAEDWNSSVREGELRGLPRVIRKINEVKPDLVCFQEMHQNHPWTGHVDMPALIQRDCGFVFTAGSNGVCQIGRRTAKAARTVPLGSSAALVCDYGDFIVATTHYSTNEKLATASAEATVRLFEKADKPVIFCGDLNLTPDKEPMKLLLKHFLPLSDVTRPTAHALAPDACLDYILVDRAHADCVRATGFTVGTGSNQASDHFPIWIDLSFRPISRSGS